MASFILSSQQKYDQKFYLPGLEVGRYDDDFIPRPIIAKDPAAVIKTRIPPNGSATAGLVNSFYIQPRTSMLADMVGEIQLGAPGGGTYCNYPGICMPTSVEIKHGGSTLMLISDYQAWFNDLISRIPVERTARFLAAAGGATPGAGTFYFPIPSGWASWTHASAIDAVTPFPLCASKTPLQINITLSTVANVLASGGSGGSLVAFNLLYIEELISQEKADLVTAQCNKEEYSRQMIDWQSVPPSTIATATATDVDLSGLTGAIKELTFINRLVSDVDTAHSLYINKNLTTYTLKTDGWIIYQPLTNLEILMDGLLFNQSRIGTATTVGCPDVYNFARLRDSHSWTGDLNSLSFKKFTVNVTHAAGANTYLTPFATRTVIMKYRAGLFYVEQ